MTNSNLENGFIDFYILNFDIFGDYEQSQEAAPLSWEYIHNGKTPAKAVLIIAQFHKNYLGLEADLSKSMNMLNLKKAF